MFNTTKLDFKDFTYTWVIEDFRNFKFYNSKRQLESTAFVALNNGKPYTFRLQLYCDRSNGNVWVRCTNIEPCTYVVAEKTVCIKYSIVDSSSKEIYVVEDLRVIEYNLPYSKLAEVSDVLTDRVLNKGNLTVKCRIRFHNSVLHSQSDVDPNLLLAATKPSILDDLENLLKSKKLSDVKLIVGNEEFQVHKFVLAVRSPVFSSMFETNMRENRENVVEINDISPEIMKEVLRFIYTDKANIESLPVMDLLAAADKYQIESLRVKCLETIVARLSVDNVAEVLAIVDRYEIPELRKYAIYFLTARRAEIAAKNNWDEMISSLSPSMLKELVTALMK